MSKEVICRFLNSKQTHISKSNQKDSEMLNLDSKCAQYWQKASIHELSIYKL